MKQFLLGFVLAISTAFSAVAATTATASTNVTLTKDNVLVMNEYFESMTVANLAQKAKEMDAKLKSNEPLYLVIDSGGGSIDAGIELIENLNNLNRPVHTITLFAASMGFQTVQGVNGKRLITGDGTLMSHKARGRFGGEFPGQLDSRYSYYLRRIQRLDDKVVARSGGKHTAKSYADLIENEYWCDGKDCISQGFADSIVNAQCNESLKGTHNKLYDRFIYMGHVIEIVDTFSNCPLITGELSWNVFIDGEPLFSEVDALVTRDRKEGSFYRDYSEAVLASIGLETAENIKKLVTKRLDARNTAKDREIKKY